MLNITYKRRTSMSFQKGGQKSSYQSKSAVPVASSGGSINTDTATTHYIKNTDKEYVNGLGIWENEGEFGPYLKVTVSEALQPGTYFLSARKGHLSKIVKG
jgi:hypothetical protein